MKIKQPYLKGKSVFIVSLIVIGVTIATVYFTGINYHRTVTANLYISLSIIGAALFAFMTYGLYTGIGLKDNFPKLKGFKIGDLISNSSLTTDIPNTPSLDIGEGIGGVIMSIVLWIIMSIVLVFLMIILEAIFWISLFIILTILYWIFFRALKFVFSKSSQTKGDISISIVYALGYTFLYLGWIFIIVYLVEVLK